MNRILMPERMTTADLLDRPVDGMERWLIHGELREKPMTIRNRFHSRIVIRLGRLLDEWLDGQPEPRGSVLGGEAGVRLGRDPETTVGIDIVYISGETAAGQTEETTIVEGIPVLAVEVLSPSDTHEEVCEKVDVYLDSGVKLVWVIDPHHQTILAFRSGHQPQLYTCEQELTAEPDLPGFRVPVSRVFG